MLNGAFEHETFRLSSLAEQSDRPSSSGPAIAFVKTQPPLSDEHLAASLNRLTSECLTCLTLAGMAMSFAGLDCQVPSLPFSFSYDACHAPAKDRPSAKINCSKTAD